MRVHGWGGGVYRMEMNARARREGKTAIGGGIVRKEQTNAGSTHDKEEKKSRSHTIGREVSQ